MPTPETFGAYRLLRKLASGGMGEVYAAKKAQDPENAHEVALKRILPHLAREERFTRHFLNEVKIQAALNHPNLVRVLDFGREDDSFFMTMELLSGQTLDTLLEALKARGQSLAIPAAIELVRQALAGIGYAHSARDKDGRPLGIVHLDLSPRNLFICESGQVKILDFGIARKTYAEDKKAHNALIGSPAYLSPEQAREEAVGPQSDLFTLGIVLYEASVGTTLFGNQATPFLTLKAITSGLVPPPSNLIKNYPGKLEAALYKALDVKQEKRFATAGDFAHALEEVVKAQKFESGPQLLQHALRAAHEPLPPHNAAYRSSTTQLSPVLMARAKKSAPKHATAWVFGLFALLLLLGGLGFSSLQNARTLKLPARSGSLVYVAQSGTIRVESEPAGAKVLLNGTEQSAPTPLTLENLPLDKPQKIEIRLDGYQSAEKTFTLSAQTPSDGYVVELQRGAKAAPAAQK